MLHATPTAENPALTVVAVRSQDELDADYPKEVAKDRRDQRRALEVPGMTVGVRDAVLPALVAYDAAEALYAIHRTLDAANVKNQGDPALARRRDRADARWQRAREGALKAAEKVLTAPTAPGAETAAKFQAFMLLTYVPNTNARHRKTFTIERAVEAMFDEDAKRVLVRALKAISTTPTPSTAPIDRSAWDAAMAKFQNTTAKLQAVDEQLDEIKNKVFGAWIAAGAAADLVGRREIEGRERLFLRWGNPSHLQADHQGSIEERWTGIRLAANLSEHLPTLKSLEQQAGIPALDEASEALRDQWFEDLEVLERLQAPDAAAMAFKLRHDIALENELYPHELDDPDNISRLLSLEPKGALKVRLYQDALRLSGASGPIVDAQPWNAKPWIAEFRAMGGEIELSEMRAFGEVDYDAAFIVDNANPNAPSCREMIDGLPDWRRKAVAFAVLTELREATKDAAAKVDPIDAHLIAAE